LKRTETVELNEAAGKTETKYMYCKWDCEKETETKGHAETREQTAIVWHNKTVGQTEYSGETEAVG
jgi:hypothetical protein